MADGTEPVTVGNLASVLGADAQSDAPVSAGNLKALVDGGTIGAVDVLFRSESGATSGTLSAPVEDYDVVCAIFKRSSKYWYMACANPQSWNTGGEAEGSSFHSQTAPRISGNVYESTGTSGRNQQSFNTYLNMKGTKMQPANNYIGQSNALPVHLVIGIKHVGGGFS